MPTPPATLSATRASATALAVATLLGFATDARALSETIPDYKLEQQDQAQTAPGGISGGAGTAPAPSAPNTESESSRDITRPDATLGEASPEIIYDESQLPEPVQRMRRLIIEACRSGDIEKLRPLLGTGEDATQILLGELEGDPIDFLRQVSGDDQGHEIMAILLEVMQSGFVKINSGTEEEHYVWPYFFAMPLEELTPPQKVELYTLLTASDYEEMKNFGSYVFYRSAITPEGRWVFFVAGD